jgi:Na+-driven multidrug efflux pump
MAGETAIVNTLLGRGEHGREALAAYAVYYRVFSFVVMPAIAASVAMLPFAARRFGAKDVSGVRAGLREAHAAGVIYIAIVAPILFLAAEPLARQMTASPTSLAFLVPALRFAPVGALIAMPFFLCRPVFEGLGLGRPGLLLSILRYVVLAAPAAWWGVHFASSRGISPVLGVALGVSVAAVLSSAAMLLWTRSILSRA